MKLDTKERYFFGKSFESFIREFAKFNRDVYDDLRKIHIEILNSLPTPSQDYRGRIVIVPQAGVDKIYICRKNGSIYEWKEIQVL